MQHKWVKDEAYSSTQFKERHVCSVCQCERYNFEKDGAVKYMYARKGFNDFKSRVYDCNKNKTT